MVHRAPVEVALAVFTAVLLSISIETAGQLQAWPQFAVANFMAFSCAWTATLLYGMRAIAWRTRWIATLTGVVAAAAYLLAVDTIQLEAEGWRALMLVAAAVLLTFAAPAWIGTGPPASLRLRRINGRILLRAIGIGLYGLALFGGLALALAAIDNLFDLELKSEIYAHVFGWIMLVLVPCVIVGGLDSYLEPLDRVSDVARVVQRLAAFLVPPLLALYYLILVVYGIRILMTGELPKNLVSPMVLAAGLLTALAVTLFDPAADDARAGQRALRWAPLLFLLLSPLGLWALAARIDQYGWTEFRLLRVWLLVLLVLLAAGATLQRMRRRPFALRVIPLALGATLALAAVGPWSVLVIAKRDQQNRLRVALRAAGPVGAGGADTTRRAIPREWYDRINSTGQYLSGHFGNAAVADVVAAPVPEARGWLLADVLGFMPALNDTAPTTVQFALPPNARIPVSAGTLYRVQAPSSNVRVEGRVLLLEYSARPLRVSLEDVLPAMAPARSRGPRTLPAAALSALDASGQKRGELVIFDALVQQTRDSIQLLRLEGVLLLR